MAVDKKEESAVKLESYTLEQGRSEESAFIKDRQKKTALATTSFDAADILPIKITLQGQCFMISSFDPKIMIGDVQLKDFETLSDQRTIVGYLYEIPDEGSVISIDYGGGKRAELPERFSLNKLR